MASQNIKVMLQSLRAIASEMAVRPEERQLEKYATICTLLQDLRHEADRRHEADELARRLKAEGEIQDFKPRIKGYGYMLEKLTVVKDDAQALAGLLDGLPGGPATHYGDLCTAVESLSSQDCFNV